MSKPRVATAWLGGCSGCHMSFLDMDERLVELAARMELVYSPIADVKEFPANVDFAFVEGSVTNSENLELAHVIRRNARFVVSFGDCATTGNVTAMRNTHPLDEVTRRAYVELADGSGRVPDEHLTIARLLKVARPLHEVIPVDAYLHGCPPTADQIWQAVDALLKGERPAMSPAYLRYG